jgi:hypothetical protein
MGAISPESQCYQRFSQIFRYWSKGITKPRGPIGHHGELLQLRHTIECNELSDRKFSLSLAMLTQHLLNGEIVNNGQSDNHSLIRNIFDFLKNQSLDSFKCNQRRTHLHQRLSIYQGKTFEWRRATFGHLWKIGKRIEVKCEAKLPWEDSTRGGLEGHQSYRLKQLAHELGTGMHGRRYEIIFSIIWRKRKCRNMVLRRNICTRWPVRYWRDDRPRKRSAPGLSRWWVWQRRYALSRDICLRCELEGVTVP